MQVYVYNDNPNLIAIETFSNLSSTCGKRNKSTLQIVWQWWNKLPWIDYNPTCLRKDLFLLNLKLWSYWSRDWSFYPASLPCPSPYNARSLMFFSQVTLPILPSKPVVPGARLPANRFGSHNQRADIFYDNSAYTCYLAKGLASTYRPHVTQSRASHYCKPRKGVKTFELCEEAGKESQLDEAREARAVCGDARETSKLKATSQSCKTFGKPLSHSRRAILALSVFAPYLRRNAWAAQDAYSVYQEAAGEHQSFQISPIKR